MWKILRQISRTGIRTEPAPDCSKPPRAEVERIHRELLDILGQALTIRQVDPGSCNGCELEIHALNNAVYDVERFGMRFAASPRHADVLLVTGPVTRNMKVALERTYAATPDPKWVVAAGDCACGCGVFEGSYAVIGAVEEVIPVDLHISGCPPRPIDLLRGLIALIDRATAGVPARTSTP